MIPDHIQNLQDDVWGALSADGGFQYVPVYRSRTPLEKDANGDAIPGQSTMIEDDIDGVLSGIVTKNGKCGIAVIVMLPDVKPVSDNSVGPSMAFTQPIRVIEDRLFNEGSTGTGISASRLSLHIAQILNRRVLRGSQILYPDAQKMIQEISLPGDRMAHEIIMHCKQSVDRVAKVAQPTCTADNAEITLACVTPGASIYYTLDESWPVPETATLYTTPFFLDPGSYALRVVATLAGSTPSDDLWADLQVTA